MNNKPKTPRTAIRKRVSKVKANSIHVDCKRVDCLFADSGMCVHRTTNNY